MAGGGKGADPESKAARGSVWGTPSALEPACMSAGCEATWPKKGAAVINAPCLGCRHQNEMDEGSG